jgi:hypothetical protein
MTTAIFHWTSSLLFWIAFALLLIGMLKRNLGAAAIRPDGEVHFVPRWWFVCSWMYITVRLGFVGWGYIRAGVNERLQLTTAVLVCISVILALSAIPGTIKATSEALEEVRWFGRNKKIRWTEIEEIDIEKRSSTVTVVGSGHRKIIFTNVYPDRPRLMLSIRQHCSNDLLPNFPDGPVNADSAG